MRATLLFFVVAVFVACVGADPERSSSSSGSSSGGGGGASARTVQCNDRLCDTGEVCCLTFGASGSSVEKAECTSEIACAKPFLECDGRGDCDPGEICCVGTNGNSVRYGPSYCAKECSRDNPDRQLCNDSSECASGSCVATEASVTPTTLKVCTK